MDTFEDDEFIRAGDAAWFPKPEAVERGVLAHEGYYELAYAVGLNSEHHVTRDDFEIRTRSRVPDAIIIDTGGNLLTLQAFEILAREIDKRRQRQ